MNLTALHSDGFSEHRLTWHLYAESGVAVIEASWTERSGRVERLLEMPFPDARIEEFARVLRGLKPKYDGHVDDFPRYCLAVEDNGTKLQTRVSEGINWPEAERRDIELFKSLWVPLSREIETLLVIPGRVGRRKK